MTNFINIFFIFITTAACTTKLVSLTSLKQNPKVKVTVHNIHTPKEAQYYVQNQINFLKLLFQQSRDPYYGTPKWNEQCLLENKIGNLESNDMGIWSISELYLDSSGFPGHCATTNGAIKSKLIYVFCKKDGDLLEIKYSLQDQSVDLPKILCP